MAWEPVMLLWPHGLALVLALLLDAFLGDPVYPWHPVRLIGLLIQKLEKDMYPKGGTPGFYLLTGGFLVMGVLSIVGTVYASFARVIHLAYQAQGPFWWLGLLMEVVLIYQLLAARCLWDEGHRISKVMATGDIELARKEIGYLVSRETKDLSPQAIYKAAVETLTENITDGIIAPLLAYSCFGIIGLALYKAINTMDSMIAYKNERYLYFGRLAARLDDVANFIPARIAAVLIIGIAFIRKDRGIEAIRCFTKHRRYHSSPNAGCSESAMAGALGIQLSGPTTYFGQVVERPYIGFTSKEIGDKELQAAMSYVFFAAALMGLICVLMILFLRWRVYV